MQVATIAWFEADSICGSHAVAIPIVLVLPYLFRLFQCLRQYKDTREKTTLLNGKFLSSLLPFCCEGRVSLILDGICIMKTPTLKWEIKYKRIES